MVGELRVRAIAACAPLVQDAVVAGHDRDYVSACSSSSRLRRRSSAARELARAPPPAEALLRPQRGEPGVEHARRPRSIVLADEAPSIDRRRDHRTRGTSTRPRRPRAAAPAFVARLYARPAGRAPSSSLDATGRGIVAPCGCRCSTRCASARRLLSPWERGRVRPRFLGCERQFQRVAPPPRITAPDRSRIGVRV